MQLTPYLNFDRQCAEAFRFYHQVLGGELRVQTHGESPMKEHTPPDWHDAVLHARLETDGAVLMGSDLPPNETARPQGFAIAIGVTDPDEADRIFAGLADGATVTMPIAATFWARRFGMLTDRYGIPWMVNCE
jgi:PhnB protein